MARTAIFPALRVRWLPQDPIKVRFPTPGGKGQSAGRVVEVRTDGAVCFDFNHPLAGQPVSFEVQLIGVL